MSNPLKIISDLATAWWTAHGTKIMGFWTAAVGAITYIDEKTVNLIGTTLGDAWAHGILVVSGLVTAYRGFTTRRSKMGLTDKAIEVLLALLFLVTLGFLCEQEAVLRHANALVTKQLNVELTCDKGSTCAQKLSAESAEGETQVAQAKAQAALEAAQLQTARNQQAVDVAQQLQAEADAAQKEALAWKAKYAAALKLPSCEAWAKQVRACTVP